MVLQEKQLHVIQLVIEKKEQMELVVEEGKEQVVEEGKEKGGKVQVPIDDYEKNLDKLVIRMKKTRAKLVWRNTTPVPPGSKGRYVGDSIRFNEAAARVMKTSASRPSGSIPTSATSSLRTSLAAC